jgi:hypothetical protein
VLDIGLKNIENHYTIKFLDCSTKTFLHPKILSIGSQNDIGVCKSHKDTMSKFYLTTYIQCSYKVKWSKHSNVVSESQNFTVDKMSILNVRSELN